MSRQPTFYDFSILDDHYNSNFKWVDVKGRCNYFLDASYHHLTFLFNYVSVVGLDMFPGLGTSSHLPGHMPSLLSPACKIAFEVLLDSTWVCQMMKYFIIIFWRYCFYDLALKTRHLDPAQQGHFAQNFFHNFHYCKNAKLAVIFFRLFVRLIGSNSHDVI